MTVHCLNVNICWNLLVPLFLNYDTLCPSDYICQKVLLQLSLGQFACGKQSGQLQRVQNSAAQIVLKKQETRNEIT